MSRCKASIHCDTDASKEHPCPYQEDVNNDSDFTCNCCEQCTYDCAMDILMICRDCRLAADKNMPALHEYCKGCPCQHKVSLSSTTTLPSVLSVAGSTNQARGQSGLPDAHVFTQRVHPVTKPPLST